MMELIQGALIAVIVISVMCIVIYPPDDNHPGDYPPWWGQY